MFVVKDLKQINKKDIKIAGGKGASLGEMLSAGIPVPAGFVILATAFEKFKKDLVVEVEKELRRIKLSQTDKIEIASQKIQKLILNNDIPKNIEKEIEDSFAKLNSKFVAVRSSATAEDSRESAWAGQLETYLNTDKKTLLINVKKCWASLFNSRAILYCLQKKLDIKKISVAVVVQEMIQSDVAGIAFSTHPVLNKKDWILIEAGLGLGEAVVSGQITPDSYFVEKNLDVVFHKIISKQDKFLTRSGWKKVSKKEKEIQKIADEKILQLAEIIKKIENHYKFPVDVEWAIANNKIFITQSRPITTLKKEQKNSLLEYIENDRWFFGVRAEESLFFYSAKCSGYKKYMEKECGVKSADTLLMPIRNNYPIRVFNLFQSKIFHAVSQKRVLKNPKILSEKIKKDETLYKEILTACEKIKKQIKENNFAGSKKIFEKIINNYEQVGAVFLIIFSLGLKLTERKKDLKNIESVLAKHDEWRNAVALKEEQLGEALYYFFRFVLQEKKLKMHPTDLMKNLTINEIRNWLNGKISEKKVKEIISQRKKNGYVYACSSEFEKEIIDEPFLIKKIVKHFQNLQNSQVLSNELKGEVAFGKGTIKGEVIIIKDKKELSEKSKFIKGKIVVAIQTTPHFIPYLKDAKAIITDEGGLTCHAAIVARELKKPCLVGTKFATEKLKDGAKIEINFNSGIVK